MTYDDLKAVNSEFNAFTYKTEIGDDWTPINLALDGKGDCDSYATAKAEKLLKMGWPRSALRFGICKLQGKGHAALLADLDGQTWVLDNNYALPMEHQMVQHKWIEFIHLDTGRSELA